MQDKKLYVKVFLQTGRRRSTKKNKTSKYLQYKVDYKCHLNGTMADYWLSRVVFPKPDLPEHKIVLEPLLNSWALTQTTDWESLKEKQETTF